MRRHFWTVLILVLVAWVLAGCKHPFVNSGNIYLDQNLLPKAEYCYRYAIDEEAQNSEAHFQLAFTLSEMAKTHMAEGDMDSARVKFAEATDHYLTAGQLDSLKYFDDGELNISSNFARVFNEGSKLVRAEQNEAALEYYRLAYTIDPRGDNGIRARDNIIKLQYGFTRDEFVEARNANDEPRIEELNSDLNDLLFMIDDTVALVDPDDAETKRSFYDVKASILRMLGRASEAQALYEELLDENPDDINLILNLARAQSDQGEYSSEANFYEQAIDLIEVAPLLNEDGRYDYLYGNAALAHFRADEYEAAIKRYLEALDLTQLPSEQIQILDRIAVSHFEMEQYADAVTYAQQVTELAPDHINGWQVQCRGLGRLDRLTEAESACAKFKELQGSGS